MPTMKCSNITLWKLLHSLVLIIAFTFSTEANSASNAKPNCPTPSLSPSKVPRPTMNDTQPIWYEFRNTVYEGNFAKADQMLKMQPALISMRNGIGETVLHFLAVENDLRGVEWIFKRGGDLNSTNQFGEPILFEVAQLEYKELFIWLVKHGANPKATDGSGQTLEESLIEFDKKEMAAWVRKNGA